MDNTLSAKVSELLIGARASAIAGSLRARGYPVMGVDSPDMFEMVGLTFRTSVGKLVNFRLHYDLATEGNFQRLFGVFEDTPHG